MTILTTLVVFHSGYNSTEAFNDRRLVDIAHCFFTQNKSQGDESLSMLNTAVCHSQTHSITEDSTRVDVSAQADNEEMPLTDLKLGVSVPVSLATEFVPTRTVTTAEPVLPVSEPPVKHLPFNPSQPGVNPEALAAVEVLLGSYTEFFLKLFCTITTDLVLVLVSRKIDGTRFFCKICFFVI